MDIFEKCYDLSDVDFAKKAGIYGFYRKCQGFDGSNVVYEGKSIIMTASNNYLGLASDPRVIEASVEATRKFGTSCTGSRFLNGNLEIHEELEGELAAFVGKQAAIVLSTGFLANQAAIESIAGPKDNIFSDSENHASIISGCSLSKANVIRYDHNNMNHLQQKVGELASSDKSIIISDGVFSMGGDIVDLPAMVKAAQRPGLKRVPIMIDDAHGLGVIGKGGRGTASHFKMDDDVDLIVGTFSKSLASLGGFIAGDAELIAYIKHKARSLLFTAGLPAGQTAAALQALRIMKREPERIERLQMTARKVRAAFKSMGLNTLNSQTPIIPILIGEEGLSCRIAQELFSLGVFATPVIFPGVPYGQSIIRTSFMTTHTDAQIDQVINIFGDLTKRYGLDKVRANRDMDAAHGARLHAQGKPRKAYTWTKGIGVKNYAIAGTKALVKKQIMKLAYKI
ncbi:MAG: pyridoxal phosphate-dependent aminotransferase family protein [Oligoflexus sp.]|nr:pyridoxal phosphate-dependent aminotransferase family protein [Oligoflexus sp.]